MLEDILRQAFRLANQRLGLIFLDILWKGIWLIATIVALILAFAWFGADVRTIGWPDTGVSTANAWLAATLFREWWASHRTDIILAVGMAILFSIMSWFVLEAFFRRKLVRFATFKVYLLSNLARCLILGASSLILATVWRAGAPALALVILLALALFLTLLDTLIRGDAIELLGTDLIRVTGLIGILVSFETMVGASCAIILVAGFLHVARLVDAVAMLGAAGVCILILNLLHGYLLLVRFSAVEVMSGCECKPDRAQPSS
jgi:hypothetical protein